jgi:hypothetical protein
LTTALSAKRALNADFRGTLNLPIYHPTNRAGLAVFTVFHDCAWVLLG